MPPPINLQRQFLVEYFTFGRMLNAYEAKACLEAHDRSGSKEVRRLHFVNLHASLANSLETLAAVLLALRTHAEGGNAFDRLLTYRPGEARLVQVMQGLTNPAGFVTRFGIDRVAVQRRGFPMTEFDARVGDLYASTHIAAQTQESRIHFYNKTKHGKVVVLSDDGGRALYPTAFHYLQNNPENRLASTTITYASGQVRVLFNQCIRIANAIGDLVMFHILSYHDVAYGDLQRVINDQWRVIRIRPR